jgi:hypothetical protein
MKSVTNVGGVVSWSRHHRSRNSAINPRS